MPPVGAFLAGLTFKAVITGLVKVLLLGMISRALFKPKAYDSSLDGSARERTLMVRSAVEPHRIIIGMALVSGPIAYIELSGANKEYLHVVVLLAGHEVEAIEDMYFDDVLVDEPDGGGNVTTGTFANLARIKKHLGASDQAADADLIAESAGKWTADHKLSGIAYVYVRLKRDDTAFPSGLPQIRALVKGRKFSDPRVAGSPNSPTWSFNPALAIRDYLIASFGLGAAETEINDTALAAAANASEERVVVTYTSSAFTLDAATDMATFASIENRFNTGDPVVPSTTGSLAGTGLTAGTVYWYVRSNSTSGMFATSRAAALAYVPGSPSAAGIIDITGAGTGTHTLEPRAVVTGSASTNKLTFEADEHFIAYGDGVQISSTASLPGGLAAATTYYAIKTRAGEMKLAASYAQALASAAIDLTSDGTGTIAVKHIDQARYTASGSYTLGESPDAIISALLSSMAGVMSYSQGTYAVFAGLYNSPTQTIGEDDLRGPISGTTGPDAREIFNAVRGTYVDQFKFWQPTDFPPVTNATYIAEDGGEQIQTDIEYPMVTDVIRAQRLAKIHLERARRAEAIVLPCKLTMFKAAVWETAEVTIERLGYASKVFRITGWRFAWDENGPGVDLTLVAEDSNVYGWSAADASVVFRSPDLVLPNPRVIAAPVGLGSPSELSLTAERATDFQVSDPNITVVIRVDWDPAPEPNGRYYEVNWKRTDQTAWQPVLLQFSGDTEYRIKETDSGPLGSPDTVRYDVRVRTHSHMGGVSAWLQGAITVVPAPVLANTGDIQTNAVTVVTSGYTAEATFPLPGSPSPFGIQLQQITLDCSGEGPVLLHAIAVVQLPEIATASDAGGKFSFRIMREGSPRVTIVNQQLTARGYLSGSVYVWASQINVIGLDTLAPLGQLTYTFEGWGEYPVDTPISSVVSERLLYAQELKR